MFFISSSPVSIMTERNAGAVLLASLDLRWLCFGVVLAVYMFVYLGRVHSILSWLAVLNALSSVIDSDVDL